MHKSPWYVTVQMNTGQVSIPYFESLQVYPCICFSLGIKRFKAFWPGLQTLNGDISKASDTMRAFQTIWRKFGFVPESFNLASASVVYRG
jgi:mannosidase alpha-like ER degradation enhancer 2